MSALYKKKKIFTLLFIVISIIVVTFGLCTSLVNASPAASQSIEDIYTEEKISAITGNLPRTGFRWALAVYGGSMLKKAEEVLALKFDDASSVEATLWNVAQGAYDIFAAVGICIAVVYCLIGLLDKVQTDNFNLEALFKTILKLFVAILFLSNGFNFLCDGIAITNNMLSSMTSYANEASGQNNTAILQLLNGYYQLAYSTNTGSGMMQFAIGAAICCDLLIPYIGMLAAKIVILLISYARVVEIVARVIFAPIGMSSILEGGLNSNGFRYFKKFVAVCLQGAVISAIVLIYTSYSAAFTLTGQGSGINQLIMSFVAVSAILKSQSWANDVMGV